MLSTIAKKVIIFSSSNLQRPFQFQPLLPWNVLFGCRGVSPALFQHCGDLCWCGSSFHRSGMLTFSHRETKRSMSHQYTTLSQQISSLPNFIWLKSSHHDHLTPSVTVCKLRPNWSDSGLNIHVSQQFPNYSANSQSTDIPDSLSPIAD